MIKMAEINPRDDFVKVGSFLNMSTYRNKNLAPGYRRSVLLGKEVPPVILSEPEIKEQKGGLAPGVATCLGCSAPIVFNMVAKAGAMREELLSKALVEKGVFKREELKNKELMKVLFTDVEQPPEILSSVGIDTKKARIIEEVKEELKEEGLYFKMIFCGATGCMTVTTAAYPNHIWNYSYFHSAFENIGAMVAGLESGARMRLEKGRINVPHKIIGFAGDGGTLDIGIQALSGVWERNQDTLTVTYDNEAYMNTGKQRCSSTPWGADTTTAPVGKVVKGKQTNPKDIIAIALAHNIPYVAQTSPDDPVDLMTKVRKALLIPGAAYLRILSPCPPGWDFDGKDTLEISERAVDTGSFFSFEVETDNDNYARYFTINRLPRDYFDVEEGKDDVEDYSKEQGRFRHMFRKEELEILQIFHGKVDRSWENMREFFGIEDY
ncbi:MAG: thiamine pyrophosphate-dependent enzyme [Candidatus Glassbacteria bacterium]